MKRHIVVFSTLLSAIGLALPHAASPLQQIKPARAASQSPPEAALRAFLSAMLTHDAIALRNLTQPVSEADFRYLVGPAAGKPPSAEMVRKLRAMVASMGIKSLKQGEVVPRPHGGDITVPSDSVGPDRAMLLPDGMPLPIAVQKVKGKWRVDAISIIAARKAAERMSKKGRPPQR